MAVNIVGDSLKSGYRFQRYWDVSMATAFFCCELGAGLFMFSMYVGFIPGMAIGLIFAGIGKPYFHLAHMGVPLKSWRAILRPDRSWISRGLIGIILFISGGVIYLANLRFGILTDILGPGPGNFIFKVTAIMAVIGSLIAMTYQGFAMSHSSSFALWHTVLMPISSFFYSVTCGIFGVLALGWSSFQPELRATLTNAAMIVLLVDLVVILSQLHTVYNSTSGGRASVELLIKTLYAKHFLGLVLVLGLLVPVLLLWLTGDNMMAIVFATGTVFIGFFIYRVLIFKAALYEPIMTFGAHDVST